MTRALYLGRFQLFHLGHLDVLRHIEQAPDVTGIVIAVGSTQYDWQHRSPDWPWRNNPFTHAERGAMIDGSLAGALAKPWTRVGVADTHEHESWFASLVAAAGPFDVLYSADEDERRFFAAHGVEARGFPRRYGFHSGSLRRRLADGIDVTPFVPEGTARVLASLPVHERMRALVALDEARES